MTKNTIGRRIRMLALAALLLSALFLSACDLTELLSMGVTDMTYENAELYTAGTFETKAPVTEIFIAWVYGGIVFETGEAGTVRLYEEGAEGLQDELVFRSLLRDGKLDVRYTSSGQFRLKNVKKTLHVVIPEGQHFTKIAVSSVNTETVLCPMEADEAAFELVAGSVTSKGPGVFGKIVVDSTSADVAFAGTFLNGVDLVTVSGNMELLFDRDVPFKLTFNRASTKSGLYSDFETKQNGRAFTHGESESPLPIVVSSMSGSLSLRLAGK